MNLTALGLVNVVNAAPTSVNCKNDATCALVNSSIIPVLAVALPNILPVVMFCIFAYVTASSLILAVITAPLPNLSSSIAESAIISVVT